MGRMTKQMEQEHRAEAERLTLLSVSDQRAIIAMHRADGKNPRVPKQDREFANQRAEALEHLLGLNKRRKR